MIEVQITRDEVVLLNGKDGDAFIIEKLRKAGIPVRGVLKFEGVERGQLMCFPGGYDSFSPVATYVFWQDEADQPLEVASSRHDSSTRP